MNIKNIKRFVNYFVKNKKPSYR